MLYLSLVSTLSLPYPPPPPPPESSQENEDRETGQGQDACQEPGLAETTAATETLFPLTGHT